MSHPPAHLIELVLSDWQRWYMVCADFLFAVYDQSGLVAFKSFSATIDSEPDIQFSVSNYIGYGLAVTLWQRVFLPEKCLRIHILVCQSQPIHPLSMQLIADAYKKDYDSITKFYGWHPMGYTYEEQS